MTPLKFWKRKLPLTLAWILVCAAMGVLLSTGFSLYDTMRGLPDFVEKNNKTVALIGESHVVSQDEDGLSVGSSTAITEREYEILSRFESVKDIHVNTIAGAYSSSFYAGIPWEAYSRYNIRGASEPYNNAIVVGKVMTTVIDETGVETDITLNDGEAERHVAKMCSVDIVVEKLYLFNDVFTENVFSDFKYVTLTLQYYSADEAPLLEFGDRCIFYVDNYRYTTNYGGPSAACYTGGAGYGYFGESGLQVIRVGDELKSFISDGATYRTEEIPYVDVDGTEGIYTHTEMTGLSGTMDSEMIPVMSRLDGEIEDFLAENEDWQKLFTHLETVNNSLPVVGTDCLEGQYAFVTDRAKIIEGRAFTPEEYESGAKVLIVSRDVAEKGNISVGDRISLSQFLLNRDAGRTDDYFTDQSRGNRWDFLVNINPTVGSYVKTPEFSTENEEFEVVGIYDQSEKWEENMFAFTPNTVFMPKGAQADGGYGGLAHNDGDSHEIVRGGAEGVGLVIEIKNGMMDLFREEAAEAGLTEGFLLFDQGYEDAIIPARLLASMGRSLFIIVFCGWLLLLTLYVLLYQLKQNKTLGTMRSVGATSAVARRYVFTCSLFPALVGVSIGTGLGMLLVGAVQTKIFELILGSGDMAEESDRFAMMLTQNQTDPMSLIPVSVLQILVIAAALWVCAFVVAKRPPRSLSAD